MEANSIFDVQRRNVNKYEHNPNAINSNDESHLVSSFAVSVQKHGTYHTKGNIFERSAINAMADYGLTAANVMS
jgi:hypothetical protein